LERCECEVVRGDVFEEEERQRRMFRKRTRWVTC